MVNKPEVKYYSRTPKDCAEWFQHGEHTSGVYEVNMFGNDLKQVYCEMEKSGGGWLVFQRRFDGSVDFYGQDWNAYKEGFGDANGEYWLGNKWLNLLTTSETHDYLVWAKAFDGGIIMKRMLGVRVANEDEGFKITFEQEAHDFIPDKTYGMDGMNGMKFSTIY